MSFIDFLLVYGVLGILVSVLTFADKTLTERPDRAFLRFVVAIWPFYLACTTVLGIRKKLGEAVHAFPKWFEFVFSGEPESKEEGKTEE